MYPSIGSLRMVSQWILNDPIDGYIGEVSTSVNLLDVCIEEEFAQTLAYDGLVSTAQIDARYPKSEFEEAEEFWRTKNGKRRFHRTHGNLSSGNQFPSTNEVHMRSMAPSAVYSSNDMPQRPLEKGSGIGPRNVIRQLPDMLSASRVGSLSWCTQIKQN
ncbi:hypothetical protein L218DRAFT_947958 [Marasmius fiardii PR-910]|nr:hypothetical protein L218DRAFT_947958 [Marasmius fiardii PR-910]